MTSRVRAALETMNRRGRTPKCFECGRIKEPIGRDSRASGDCDSECVGYRQPPYPDFLWPSERLSDHPYGPEGEAFATLEEAVEDAYVVTHQSEYDVVTVGHALERLRALTEEEMKT